MDKRKFIFLSITALSLIIAWYILSSGGKIKVNNSLINDQKITLNIIGKTGSSTDFFENARREFTSLNPNIAINYIGLGTFPAIDYIIKDNDIDGWLCADETGADILKDTYAKEHNGKNIILDASPIVTSPLVFVGWEDRLNNLNDITISSLYDIVSQGKTWQALGGKPNWGFVNFSHTNPIESNSGIQFITLLIHNYYNKLNTPKKDLTVADIADPKLVEYIKGFEKNTAKQEDGSGKFIDSMILYGPSRYDIGAIYEYYALSNIKNAKGRWGNLKIVYPNPTIWSNKPFIILNGPKATKGKIEAAKKFRDYLLNPEVQKKAMLEGYRPANTSVSDLTYLENEYKKYGFMKDIPVAVSAPSNEAVQSIQSLIKRIQ